MVRTAEPRERKGEDHEEAGHGRLAPSTAPGPLPGVQLARQQPADLQSLQRLVGNRQVVKLVGNGDLAVQRLGPFKSKGSKSPKPEGPYVATIKGEKIRVADADEEAEARTIVETIKDRYKIKLSSSTTVSAIQKEYSDVPKSVRNSLETSVWEMKELRAVQAALAHYAPILGKARKSSTLSKKAQGLTSIGRVKQAIDEDTATGALDTSTLGEQFSSKKNVGFFDASTDYVDSEFTRKGATGPDNETSLEATAIHEMAHALVQPYHLSAWVSALAYWLDEDTESGEAGAEEPPTDYGETNAAEDLCESVAMYFLNPDAFAAARPVRSAFVDRVVKGWTPKKKEESLEKAVSSTGSETAPPKPRLTIGAHRATV